MGEGQGRAGRQVGWLGRRQGGAARRGPGHAGPWRRAAAAPLAGGEPPRHATARLGTAAGGRPPAGLAPGPPRCASHLVPAQRPQQGSTTRRQRQGPRPAPPALRGNAERQGGTRACDGLRGRLGGGGGSRCAPGSAAGQRTRAAAAAALAGGRAAGRPAGGQRCRGAHLDGGQVEEAVHQVGGVIVLVPARKLRCRRAGVGRAGDTHPLAASVASRPRPGPLPTTA